MRIRYDNNNTEDYNKFIATLQLITYVNNKTKKFFKKIGN